MDGKIKEMTAIKTFPSYSPHNVAIITRYGTNFMMIIDNKQLARIRHLTQTLGPTSGDGSNFGEGCG